MSALDFAILFVLLVSALIGVFRGLVSEVLSLVGWVAAFVCARLFGAPAAALMPSDLGDPALRLLGGYAAVFVAVLVLAALLRWLLRSLIHAAGLGFPDRVLGGAFGLARAGLILLAFALVAGMTGLPRQAWWRNSMFGPPLETAALAVVPWLPDAMAKRIRYS